MSHSSLLARTALGLVASVLLLGSAHASTSVLVGNIPPGSVVNSAFFSINVSEGFGATVNVHRITAPWGESTVTWNNFGGAYDPAIAGSFTGNNGWQSADVTALVQAWVNGSVPNYGLLLEQGNVYATTYRSSEDTTVNLRPELEIFYTPPGGTMQELVVKRPGAAADTVFDAYIHQMVPDQNGNWSSTFSGLVSDSPKQSLLRFEFTVAAAGPGTGEYTYWRSHPCAWPVSSIVVGNQCNSWLLAIIRMFLPVGTDKSKVMYNQLVAAKLNVLIGNDSSCIASTIAAADAWMAAHPWGSNVSGGSSAWAVGAPLAAQLLDYNQGELCAPPMN